MNGERLTFQVAGIWKLTLMIRDDQTGSIWAHADGVAVSGPLKGTALHCYPVYQTTWDEWRQLHPDTEVLTYGENAMHRDGRHGHGARDYLGRPGIRAGRSFGIKPDHIDSRLRENEITLGVYHEDCKKAYPVREVHKSGGVVNDVLGAAPIVVWSPRPDSHLTAAFSRQLNGGDLLTFSNENGVIRDKETHSLWHVEGHAIEGPLAGKSLEPLDALLLKWHGWCLFHPETELYESDKCLSPGQLTTDRFSPLLEKLFAAGYDLAIEGQVLKALLPNLANVGISVRINADPFVIYEFRSALGADEFCYAEKYFIRVGHFVLKSEPDEQYKDNAQLERLPDEQIAWSTLLEDPEFLALITDALGGIEPDEVDPSFSLAALFEGLRATGYQVGLLEKLEGRRLMVEAVNGCGAAINGDPFLIYRFRDSASARVFSDWHGRSICVGSYVLRSDPEVQYEKMGLKSIDLPSEKIEWSAMLADESFLQALEDLIPA